MDRGAWLATVHRVTKSQTQLKQLSMLSLLDLLFVSPGLSSSVRNMVVSFKITFNNHRPFPGASLVAKMVKHLPAMQKTWVRSLDWEDPWREKWLPIPIFLSGEFHGHRSLVGYSPFSHKESDLTE